MVDYALADAIYKKLISVGATPATAQIAYNSILGKTPSITVADTAYQNVLAQETKRADQIYAASITQGNTTTGSQVAYNSIIGIGKMYAQVTYDYIKANIKATTIPGAAPTIPAPATPPSTTTPSTPVSGQKEYVFEFSGNLSGLSNTAIGAINKIVQLLGGKTAYIEGNKIVVVM